MLTIYNTPSHYIIQPEMVKKSVPQLIHTINIPRINDDALLCFIEGLRHLSFEIKRVYFVLKPKASEPRGFHAHHKTNQVLFCIHGSVKLIVDNGKKRKQIILKNQPEKGVLLPPLLWHEMHDMDKSTILLVLADREYEPEDYIRDYSEFLKIMAKNDQV